MKTSVPNTKMRTSTVWSSTLSFNKNDFVSPIRIIYPQNKQKMRINLKNGDKDNLIFIRKFMHMIYEKFIMKDIGR